MRYFIIFFTAIQKDTDLLKMGTSCFKCDGFVNQNKFILQMDKNGYYNAIITGIKELTFEDYKNWNA